jgi:hypothetical protein
MKKLSITLVVLSIMLGACLPAPAQPDSATPTPISVEDLQATAEVFVQQTLQAFPTNTPEPTPTPVVVMPTETPIEETPTETPNPVLLTLTATLGTGTISPGEATGESTPEATLEAAIAGTPTVGLVFVSTSVGSGGTPTRTPRPLFHGTLPPSLPFGYITLVNKANVEVYISLRCETAGGYVTYIEYPVKSTVEVTTPAGSYTYVAWVGGRQITGAFRLSQGQSLTLDILKNRVEIK